MLRRMEATCARDSRASIDHFLAITDLAILRVRMDNTGARPPSGRQFCSPRMYHEVSAHLLLLQETVLVFLIHFRRILHHQRGREPSLIVFLVAVLWVSLLWSALVYEAHSLGVVL
jgi:hypothetical protein